MSIGASLLLVMGAMSLSRRHTGLVQGRTIYVDGSYTGAVEDGSAAQPYKTLSKAIANAINGDTIMVRAGEYRETAVISNKRLIIQTAPGVSIIGTRPWGRLANPGFQGKPIRTTLFFAGRPLDGTGSAESSDPFFNGCGKSADLTPPEFDCYSVKPADLRNLNWVDPANPTSDANRQYVLQSMIAAGLNAVSMSSWGESTLKCTYDCTNVVPAQDCGPPCSPGNTDCCTDPDVRKCIGRCFKAGGQRTCRIGWFGAAPMQVSSLAKDQLFDAARGKTILIIPFIESRFDVDWDFDDEFPPPANGPITPLLVSQIEDLITQYLRNPNHPEWAAEWARVYDQNGVERYAIAIAHAASQTLNPSDSQSDKKFADGFDVVANKVFQDTAQAGGIRVGFFLDAIPREARDRTTPAGDFGCPHDPDWPQNSPLVSIYRDASVFKPDPSTTGPYLRNTASILGIHSYMPEGWVDVAPAAYQRVNQCYRERWKLDYSKRWYETGIPFLQDVSAGYDGSKLFKNRQPSGWGRTTWGYDDEWRNALTQLVQTYGANGMVYNAWNGYCEGLAGMPLSPQPDSQTRVTTEFLQSLTRNYK